MVEFADMSLVIRLAKTGRKGERKYHLVVREKHSRRDGRPVEILGSYEKRTKEVIKDIKTDRVEYWKSQGAQVSVGAAKIL
jgi:small subunit ribosomal protein S16